MKKPDEIVRQIVRNPRKVFDSQFAKFNDLVSFHFSLLENYAEFV